MLCGQCKILVELHRRHDRKAALEAVVVVEINVVCNHLHELCPVGELVAVVAFPFQDAPEALHRAIVEAVGHAGHALLHPCGSKFLVENSGCILKSSVTVEQRVSIWLGGNSGIKGVKNELVVVVIANDESDNSPIAEVQNSAKVDFTHFGPRIVFELGHIGQPLQVGRIGMEAAAKIILCHILR